MFSWSGVKFFLFKAKHIHFSPFMSISSQVLDYRHNQSNTANCHNLLPLMSFQTCITVLNITGFHIKDKKTKEVNLFGYQHSWKYFFFPQKREIHTGLKWHEGGVNDNYIFGWTIPLKQFNLHWGLTSQQSALSVFHAKVSYVNSP